jgi:transposase
VYLMKRFIAGQDRSPRTLFPESREDDIAEDNPVRVVDVFVDGLDLGQQGFDGMQPEATGRPSYHPAALLRARDGLESVVHRVATFW